MLDELAEQLRPPDEDMVAEAVQELTVLVHRVRTAELPGQQCATVPCGAGDRSGDRRAGAHGGAPRGNRSATAGATSGHSRRFVAPPSGQGARVTGPWDA